METVKGLPWTVIDYEWTFGKPICAKETAYRALYCYILENEKRGKLDLASMARKRGISVQEEEACKEREMDFQKFVTGQRKSMVEIREAIGNRVMEPAKWMHKFDGSCKEEQVQIYADRGKGYSEEDSYFVRDAYAGENMILLKLSVDKDVETLRIDPAMDCCVVKIKKLLFNKKEVGNGRKAIVTNGRRLGNGSYVFATKDPNINIKIGGIEKMEENELEAELEIVRLPAGLAEDMAGGAKKWF